MTTPPPHTPIPHSPTEILTAPSPVTPTVPEDAPFDQGQRQWLNGLLTGLTVLARAAHDRNTGTPAIDAPVVPITILYGSQSGNCESLSKNLRKHATAIGFQPDVRELNNVDPGELLALQRVLILCSTFGEGDPPDNAKTFFEKILADDAPALIGLDYAVCGLGDSSYTFFNKAAADLDQRFDELGASRLADYVACDLAYEDDYDAWKTAVFASDALTRLVADSGANQTTPETTKNEGENVGGVGGVGGWTKGRPFSGTVLEVSRLSSPRSAKEVNHIEISLAGSGIEYAVGDALGLWPVNCQQQVQAILDAVGWSGRETVQIKTAAMPLRAALLTKLDICTMTAKSLETMGVDPGDRHIQSCHLIDVLLDDQPTLEPQQLVNALRPLQPRLYSIASSPDAHPGEVHLTVGAVRYQAHGRARQGVASTYLADRCACGTTVGVYLQPSAHFHIPADDVPLIMIGPGTGIAPFRAFLEHRAMQPTSAPNWLFFGDQHEADDFLYREQLQTYHTSGLLTRLDLAWSRDQSEKIYVQNRMMENGAELYQWLENGAAVYVCGDATRMAQDVDTALHAIIAQHGSMSAEQATAYVESLKQSHRYQRDVY